MFQDFTLDDVWSALEEVGRKGYGLDKSHKDHMEGVIGEIFFTNWLHRLEQ